MEVKKSNLWAYAAWGALIWVLGLTPAAKALIYPRGFGVDSQESVATYSSNLGGLVDSGLNGLMLGLGAAIVLLGLAARKAKLPKGGLWLWLGALAFALGTLLSSRFGSEPYFSSVFFGLPVMFTAAYLLPPVPPDWFVRRVMAILLFYAYGSLLAALVAPQWALQYAYTEGLVPGFSVRLHGLVTHANGLAFLLLVYLILSWFLPAKTRWERLHQGVVLSTLILTQSKTVWVLFALAYMIRLAYATMRLPKLQRYASFTLLGAICGGGILYLVVGPAWLDSVGATLSGERITTLNGRILIWEVTLEYWERNPWFGYGPSLWNPQMSIAYAPIMGFVATHAHNQLFQSLGETGVVGVVGLLMYVSALLAYGAHYARATNLVTLALVLVVLLRGITEPALSSSLGGSDFYVNFSIFALLVLASRRDRLKRAYDKENQYASGEA